MYRQVCLSLTSKNFAAKFSCFFFLLIILSQLNYSQTAAEITALESGKTIEREIAKGQKHDFQILMKSGDYAALIVLERNAELKFAVTDPQNKQTMEVDTPYSEGEPQSIHFIAEISGNYLFSVTPSSPNAATGSYQINVKEIRPATETDRHLAESFRLNLETRKLRFAGKYDEALAAAEKSLAILTKIYDSESAENADITNEIGQIYDYKGEYAKAEQNYLRALKMYEKKSGADHFLVASVLNNLGAVYRAMSLYEKAEAVYQRALTINEKTFNPEHLNVATILVNLGYLYYTKGEYSKVEPLYRRALSIREKQLGFDSIEAGIVINNLALLYRVKGDYPQALQSVQKVLTIFEKNLPSEHPNIALIMANLAAINTEVGDYEKAEQLYKQVLEIHKKTLSPENPAVAVVLNNLAALYENKTEYEKVESLYRRALEIREKALGAEHPLVAATLNNLGLFYTNRGEYEKAEPLFRRALEIYNKKFGSEHFGTATTNNSIALLYLEKGEYEKAEPLFLQTLKIFENVNGKSHPLTARPLGNLAKLYAAKNDFAQALIFQEKYLTVREKNLELSLYTGSERQKIAYLETLSRDMISTISLNTRLMQKSDKAKEMALELILKRKGRTFDAMAESISALRRRALAEDQKLIDELSDSRTLIANLTLRGAGNDKPEVYQQKLRTLEEEKEKLEDALSRRSAEFRTSSQAVTIDAVRAAIPENAALIEFVFYSPVDPKSKSAEKSPNPPQYVAYILRRQGAIEWKELGDAAAIDAAIDNFRQALRDPKRKDVGQFARAVDEKIMSPIRSLLDNSTQLFISPDSELNLIPFEALVDEQGKYQIENYSISYLTGGRDLLRLQTGRTSKSDPLLIANPLFDLPDATQTAKLTKPTAGYNRRKSITATRRLSDTYFTPLGGTAQEARLIQTLFPESKILSGAQATETALKQTSAPEILHIATHGFFLENEDISKYVKTKIENPLLRSGLALAGANERKSDKDDGILTALEASGLNLWGTKLVVLSACDTGLGEVRNGEGVYGLRRAFLLAGTESLIMSLWSVSDSVTRELMTNYYKNLKRGIGRNAALREVQIEMLKQKERQHPFYWASFIQSGEWSNLNGKR